MRQARELMAMQSTQMPKEALFESLIEAKTLVPMEFADPFHNVVSRYSRSHQGVADVERDDPFPTAFSIWRPVHERCGDQSGVRHSPARRTVCFREAKTLLRCLPAETACFRKPFWGLHRRGICEMQSKPGMWRETLSQANQKPRALHHDCKYTGAAPVSAYDEQIKEYVDVASHGASACRSNQALMRLMPTCHGGLVSTNSPPLASIPIESTHSGISGEKCATDAERKILARSNLHWSLQKRRVKSETTLLRFCEAQNRQQRVQACFKAWLQYARKTNQLRLQKQLQELQSAKTTAMNCLFQWAHQFVANGARRALLTRKGLAAFNNLLVQSRRKLQAGRPVDVLCSGLSAATAIWQRRITSHILSFMRTELHQRFRLQQCRSCIETATRLRRYRVLWNALKALLLRRERLLRGTRMVERAVEGCKRTIVAEAVRLLRFAVEAVNATHESVVNGSMMKASPAFDVALSKLSQIRRQRLCHWISHWRCVARREAARRQFRNCVFVQNAWAICQEWRRVAATAAEEAVHNTQRAQDFLTEKTKKQVHRLFMAWRTHKDMHLRLRRLGYKCTSNLQRQIFKAMETASRENRVLRRQIACRETAKKRHCFLNWLLFRRHRRRDKAVTHLLVISAERKLQHEVVNAWTVATAHGLAASALRCNNLLNAPWRKWKAFVVEQRRLRQRARITVDRRTSSTLHNCFMSWLMVAQRRQNQKLKAFTAWTTVLAGRKKLCWAKQKVKCIREKAILRSAMASWQYEAKGRQVCETLAKRALHSKGFRALRAHKSRAMRLKETAKLTFHVRRRTSLAAIIGLWKKLLQRGQKLRQQYAELHLRHFSRSLQNLWHIWRRKTFAATALRQWVAQALNNSGGGEVRRVLITTLSETAVWASPAHKT
ncbi:hypothetical protein Esti_005602 [Eimeria stiedai]